MCQKLFTYIDQLVWLKLHWHYLRLYAELHDVFNLFTRFDKHRYSKFYTSVPMLWLLYFIKLLMFDEQRNICCSYLLSTLIINIRLVTHTYLQNIHINGDVADNIPSVYSLQHSQVGKTRSEYNLFGISQTIKSTVPSVL